MRLIDGFFFINVIAVVVIFIIAGRGSFWLWGLYLRRPPATPRPRCSRASRSPCGILSLSQADINDVWVGEFCSMETQPDLTGLESCVEKRLGGWSMRVRGW
jgi:hypothetical protein